MERGGGGVVTFSPRPRSEGVQYFTAGTVLGDGSTGDIYSIPIGINRLYPGRLLLLAGSVGKSIGSTAGK